jgi:hypothetical protein
METLFVAGNAVFIAFIITLIIGLIIFLILGFITIETLLKKREKMSLSMVTLEVRVLKDNDIKIDAAEQMFTAFSSFKKTGFWSFLEVDEVFAFQIIAKKAEIRFFISVPKKTVDYVEKTIYAYYPSCDIKHVEEPNIFDLSGKVEFVALKLKKDTFKPVKTYKDLSTDTVAAITSALSRVEEGEGALIQILITAAGTGWKSEGKSYIGKSKKDESSPDKATFKLDNKLLEKIDEKTSKVGYKAVVRVVVNAQSKDMAKQHINNIKGAFTQFNSDYNSFTSGVVRLKSWFVVDVVYKYFPLYDPSFLSRTISILSVEELASIFHFPNKTVETPHIMWLKSKSAPVPTDVSMVEGTLIGMGYYRGIKRPVRIKLVDRRRHVYIIGKTGSGKSFLLQDMILQDIREGHGVCVMDPHGDLAENILRNMPKERAEDVIYFDPADFENPMGVNILEHETEDQKQFVTEAVLNLLYKLYDPERTGIIGPRFEHAVRNCLLTIMEEPGATLIELVRILTDEAFMQQLLPKITDPIVKRYWTDQIAQTSDFHKSETLDWIVSKFGKFVTNKVLRNIIGQSKSAFDFRDIMDNKKIIIINLSKGRLGEENSAFLGLLVIPKFVAAAMSRANMPEHLRPDFFLYVDEFQNFATKDFEIILSEARKYRLNLTVANQYIGQMDQGIKDAIFGNVGTILSYRTGPDDASYLQRQFMPTFNENDIMNAERFHLYMRTLVDNEPVPAFSVDLTKDLSKVPPPNDNLRDLLIQMSRIKFSKPRAIVEEEITIRAKL